MNQVLQDIGILSNLTNVLFFDSETSTFNKGHVYDPRNRLVSYAIHYQSRTNFAYYNDPNFLDLLRSSLASCTVVCGFNLKFDLSWCKRVGVEIPQNVVIWDLQLAEFIYSGQTLAFDSLDAALARYELPPKKKDLIKDYWEAGISTEDIPVEIVEEYNIADVFPSLVELYKVQMALLNDKQKRLVVLEGEDLKALLTAEYAGIKFDVAKAKQIINDYSTAMGDIYSSLNYYLPSNIPAGTFNWNSGDDISLVLYGGTKEYDYVKEVLTYKSGAKAGQQYNRWATETVVFPRRFTPLNGTEVAKTKDDVTATTRYYQTDQPTLSQLKAKTKEDKELLRLLKELADKTKVYEMVQSIMNKMIEKNWQDDYIHGQFNQNVVITGRLSSSQPNLQNTPPEIDALLISRYDSI